MSCAPDPLRPLSLLGWAFEIRPGEFATMTGTLLGVWLCELSLPFLLGSTVDAAVSRTGGLVAIERLGALALAISAVLYGLHTAYLRGEVRLVARGAFRLRQLIYTRILEQPLNCLSGIRKGDAVQRLMNDADVLDSHAIYLLADAPFSLLTVTGAFAVMVWMQPALALLVLTILVIITLLANRIARPLGTLQRAILHRRSGLGGRFQECLDGFRLMKSFGREAYALANLDRDGARVMDAEIASGYVQAKLEPLVQLMETFGFLAIVCYGATLVFFGWLTPGRLVAFVAYMELMREPIRSAAPYYAHYRQSAAIFARIAAFLNRLTPVPFSGTASVDGAFKIEFENIQLRRADTGHAVLYDVSFCVQPGEIIGVTGENGAGKSTLMDVLLGLTSPDSGWVLAGGIPLEDWCAAAWRDATAAVPQDPFLFFASVAENIRYGRTDASDAEIVAVAREAGLYDILERLPLGLKTIVGDRGSRLSGGERQLVALARALIRRPRLLVLDEPCASMDDAALARTSRILQAGKNERVTFIVTHDRRTLAQADRVLHLAGGRVRWIGGSTDPGRRCRSAA